MRKENDLWELGKGLQIFTKFQRQEAKQEP